MFSLIFPMLLNSLISPVTIQWTSNTPNCTSVSSDSTVLCNVWEELYGGSALPTGRC